MICRFSPLSQVNIQSGRLLYDIPDASFRYEYLCVSEHTERYYLVFGKVEIAVDRATDKLVGCSCYNYWSSWVDRELSAPNCRTSNSLLVDCKLDAASGVGYELTGRPLPEYYSPSTGWYCVGDPDSEVGLAIEFASGCVAMLLDGVLIAIWLQPENWRELSAATLAHN